MWLHACTFLLYNLVTQIEEDKKATEKERQEMLANLEKHKELERQQQEKVRKVIINWDDTVQEYIHSVHGQW